MKLVNITAGIGLMLMMAGCSSGAGPHQAATPEARIAAAKSATQEAELKLIGLIPSDQVHGVVQRREGSLLSCSASTDQWAGHARFTLADGVDSHDVTNALDTVAQSKGFTVTRDKAIDGYLRLTARTVGGVSLLIGAHGDGTEMRLSSFSACFDVPKDFLPKTSY